MNNNTVEVQFEVEHFDSGHNGNALMVVVDNNQKFQNDGKTPLVLERLSEGRHVLRAFAVNRFGESNKDPGAFVMRQFYVGKKNTELLNPALPTLTYNEPMGFYKSGEGQSVLLDFLVTQVVLSKNGYHVRYTLDGEVHELYSASPVYLTKLKAGVHTLVLEVLDKNNNLAEGNFVRTQHDFVIEG